MAGQSTCFADKMLYFATLPRDRKIFSLLLLIIYAASVKALIQYDRRDKSTFENRAYATLKNYYIYRPRDDAHI